MIPRSLSVVVFNLVVTFILLQVDTYAHEYFPKVIPFFCPPRRFLLCAYEMTRFSRCCSVSMADLPLLQ